jgi:ribosomal protein S27E
MTTRQIPNDKIAMQTRCVHCKTEQYGPAVYSVSMGTDRCYWCGKMSIKMTNAEYKVALPYKPRSK